MAIAIKLQDVDEAIENLRYKSETTLKARLLRAVRQYYADDASSESLQAIDTEELVKTVWETGDDAELLKAKRKNFSSLKSSVNTDLKKLYAAGKNPQGIVIGSANVFAISDEAKDKALSGIMDVFKDMGIDTQSKISSILTALNDVLASALSDPAMERSKEEIDRLKSVMGGITEKLGLSLDDLIGRAEAMSRERKAAGEGAAPLPPLEKRRDLSGYIEGGISAIDKGLEELAREAAEKAGAAKDDVKEALRSALTEIINVLQDTNADSAAKAKKIMSTVERIVGAAMNTSGLDVSDDLAAQLKQIFHEISEGAGDLSGAAKPEATAAQLAGGRLLNDVSDILSHEGASNMDKIRQIMSAVNGMIGETLDGTGFPSDEIAQIRKMMDHVAGNLDALAQETPAGVEDRTALDEPVRQAAAEIVGVLKDSETDVPAKARAIMSAVEKILDETIAGEGSPLSGDEIGQLKKIFQEIGEGAAKGGDQEGTAAQQAGGRLLSNVSSILGGEGLSAGDKISQIMSAVKDMIGEALAGSGLSGEEIAQIQEMMSNITGNLEAFAHEALAEEDIVEEVIEEEAGEVFEEAGELPEEEAPPSGEEEIVEVIEDVVSEEEAAETVEVIEEGEVEEPVEEAAVSEEEGPAEEVVEMVEDVLPEALEEAPPGDVSEEAVELPEEEAPPSGEEEIVEVVEDVVSEEEAAEAVEVIEEGEVEGPVEEAVVSEEEGPAEEVVESVEDVLPEALEEAPPGEEEIVEVVEDVVSEEEAAEAVEVIEEGEVEGPVEEAAVSEEEGPAEEIVEEIADANLIEEVVEEAAGAGGEEGGAGAEVQVAPSGKSVDEELREKTELLMRLAEAAGVLEKLGPDLSGSIYTEEELRGKAKFLSEEFDRYLSIRDKFFNAHILIKGGDYLVGGAHLTKSELEEQVVTLPDFYIGKFPVTNALFEIFVEQTGYVTTAEKYGYGLVYYPRMQRSKDPITGAERFILHNQAYYKRVQGACWHHPSGPDSTLHLKRTHPVVQVSLEDARAYAAWTGKRLPTEIEWEAAARMPRGNLFPWGGQWREDACNIEKSLHGDTTPVDKYLKFANAAEVADLLGNVLEWTMDVVGDAETSDTYIVKGASWVSHGEISLTDRHYIERITSSNILGFRCVAI